MIELHEFLQPERAPIAWYLGVDAEEELAGGTRYQRTDAMRAIVARQSERVPVWSVGPFQAAHLRAL